MANKAYISELPKCDMCGEVAYADANIPGVGWAYVCREDFDSYACSLGTGKGQELIVGEKPRNNPLVAMMAEELGEGYEEMEIQMEDYGFDLDEIV